MLFPLIVWSACAVHRRRLWVQTLALTLGVFITTPAVMAGTWTPLVHPAPDIISLMLLLSDGTVMAANGGGSNWYRLTPDVHGSYANGTWSTVAPMHDTRIWFASDVLTDGRVLVSGGEFGTGGSAAEVYDPISNTWTSAPPPLQFISDAPSEILPDGNVLISPVTPNFAGRTMIFVPASNSWLLGGNLFGAVNQSEASWVKLPDDSIITINTLSVNSQRYIPSLNMWISDATVPVSLYEDIGGELGAGVLLPNGRALFLGGTGHTALYTPSGSTNAGSWAAGPDIPGGLTTPDAPAAALVNGKVLCAVGPPLFNDGTGEVFPAPTSFYEYDPVANSFTAVGGPTGPTDDIPPFEGQMLDLPDGSVLYSHFSGQLYLYRTIGSPLASGKPTITGLVQNADSSFHLSGTLFNGISEGAAYGDDAQMAGNYPIVRLTNSVGNTYYARTYNWSSTSVMTSNRPVTTEFTLPPGLHTGTYSLVVIANGISSDPIPFTNTAALRVTPATGFAASGPVGGPFAGNLQVYSLTNVGSAALNWTVANTSSWLNASSTGGALTPGGPAATVTISLKPTATNLVSGLYSDTLRFTNLTDNTGQSRQFTLRVNPPQLVQNPGFELSAGFLNWTPSGNTSVSFVDNGFQVPAHSGTNLAELGRAATFGFLAQTLPTTAGKPYLVSLWLYSPIAATTNEFLVIWNGKTNLDLVSIPPLGWTNLQLILAADNTNTVLKLGFRNTQTWFGLDDISVQPVPAPVFQTISVTNDTFTFSWNTMTGLAYQVQYRTDLAQTNWINAGSPIVATGFTTTFSDFIAPDSQRFYRLLMLP